eukprot:scaffold44614_cov73-Attheya_sp.AAC.5
MVARWCVYMFVSILASIKYISYHNGHGHGHGGVTIAILKDPDDIQIWQPLTTVQSSDQDWCFLGFLMLTSGYVGKMVDVYNGDEDELQQNSSWTKIKQYIGCTSNAPSQPAPPVPETKHTPPEVPVPETEDMRHEAALAPSGDDNPDTSSNASSTPQHFDTLPIHQPLDVREEPQADAMSEEGHMVDDEQGGGQQPTQ